MPAQARTLPYVKRAEQLERVAETQVPVDETNTADPQQSTLQSALPAHVERAEELERVEPQCCALGLGDIDRRNDEKTARVFAKTTFNTIVYNKSTVYCAKLTHLHRFWRVDTPYPTVPTAAPRYRAVHASQRI